jgi:hypothetical protein
MRRLILIATGLTFGVGGHAQIRNQVELELGVNSSGLPQGLAGGSSKYLPVVSPVLGLWLSSSSERRVGVSVGVQYYITGERYSFSNERHDPINQGTVSMSIQEDMTFRQISVPLMVSYNFSVAAVKLGIAMGCRVSNFTSGWYYFRQEITDNPAIGRDYFSERGFDPFSEDLETPAKRTHPQVCLGLTVGWNARWKTSLFFSQGNGITFTEHKPPGAIWDDPSYNHTYRRGEISLTMRYLLF